ncbi:MAG: hypothetical protein N3C12_14995 [Candidatus Binatia bacterium]|nr:hypothetical protein [Candidatus Binatia bacterium]
MKLVRQVAFGVNVVLAQGFQYVLAGFVQRSLCFWLFGRCALLQLLPNRLAKLLIQPLLNDALVVVHEAVDAKIQVGQIKLEEFVK